MQEWISVLKTLPGKVRDAVQNLTSSQLETPYRPGGWTIKQVVHHLADSHMNSLIRFKLALTEDNPTIKPYKEDEWAKLRDYQLPLESSLQLLQGIHLHLTTILESLTPEQWERTFHHPETKIDVSLKRALATYAWHSNHHLAHIYNAMAKLS